MPTKVKMNIQDLTSTPAEKKQKVQQVSQKSSKNIALRVRSRSAGQGNMNLFDISETKKGCKSCGGG
jgi:hypothetical protein